MRLAKAIRGRIIFPPGRFAESRRRNAHNITISHRAERTEPTQRPFHAACGEGPAEGQPGKGAVRRAPHATHAAPRPARASVAFVQRHRSQERSQEPAEDREAIMGGLPTRATPAVLKQRILEPQHRQGKGTRCTGSRKGGRCVRVGIRAP